MESETVYGEMRRWRVLIVTSRDVRMVGLRTMFEQEPLVRSVTEVAPRGAVAAVVGTRPDAVAVCGDAERRAIVEVASEIRAVSPSLTMLVFADAVDYMLEIALGRLQVASFVLWDDVNAVSLHWLLGGTLEAGLRVVSAEAVEEVVLPAERRRLARDTGLRLTDIERSVLTGLLRGHIDAQQAADLGYAERTVRRIIVGLEVKFEVATRAELIATATELGFRGE
jgi:DNA-binding NarL/FixJ family response regulator